MWLYPGKCTSVWDVPTAKHRGTRLTELLRDQVQNPCMLRHNHSPISFLLKGNKLAFVNRLHKTTDNSYILVQLAIFSEVVINVKSLLPE